VKLYDDEGKPNHRNISAHTAVTGTTVNIEDAYDVENFDFSGTKAFDQKTGYRSKSFLTVPLKNHEEAVIGVLQLINARNEDDEIIIFGPDVTPMIEALASQAAVALDNQHLLEAQKNLFRSFIGVIAGAIDAKSPYTGGHCHRVPDLTRMLTEAVVETKEGPFADFQMSEEEWYELEVAGGLHDCGKVTTPEYVVDKATKLETIYNRIHEVRTRFEVVKRDVVIEYLKAMLKGERDPDELQAETDAKLAQLDEDYAFIAECNVGGEFMAPDKIERVKRIAQIKWIRTLDDSIGLSHEELKRKPADRPQVPVEESLLADKPDHIIAHDAPPDPRMEQFNIRPQPHRFNLGEIYNLSIGRGTLTAEERYKINEHIVMTIMMLKNLPFPKNLARVAEWAGGHHEKMDGTGYPMGLKREEMSIPARVMAIADIFEALTAADRPYKAPKKLSECIKIMSFMKKDQHVDPDLFELFLTSGVYKTYAEQYLRPEQIDEVDISQYLPKAAE
jgi:HD-GYP domain-containing protein (c-di-GMP phosphodiesterase class II)